MGREGSTCACAVLLRAVRLLCAVLLLYPSSYPARTLCCEGYGAVASPVHPGHAASPAIPAAPAIPPAGQGQRALPLCSALPPYWAPPAVRSRAARSGGEPG